MLPNFLIIGAPKAGTTWLYSRLRRHPDVFMSSVKELGFFSHTVADSDETVTLEAKDRDWYEYHFQDVEEQSAVGEATPNYLLNSSAPRKIYELIPDVKLIACLRHPTDRAYSHYWMKRGLSNIDYTFGEAVRRGQGAYVEESLYGEQLDRYLSYFDREQLLILISEEVFAAPSTSLNEICSFLGVDETFYQDQEWVEGRKNPSSRIRSKFVSKAVQIVGTWMRHTEGARQVLDALKATGLTDLIKNANRKSREYPEMNPELREELDEYYASTVCRVEEIVGREIKVWRDKMLTTP